MFIKHLQSQSNQTVETQEEITTLKYHTKDLLNHYITFLKVQINEVKLRKK